MSKLLWFAPFVGFLVSCATVPGAQIGEPEAPRVEVRVAPDATGFRAAFVFPEDAPIWAFHRSALRRTDKQPWRPDSWRILTPGVSLERIGGYDALVARSGAVPRRVDIAFTPADVDLIADYDPALVLTDGTVALYAGIFASFPAETRDDLDHAAQTSPVELSAEFTDPGHTVLHRGQATSRAVDDGERYVIYGPAAVRADTPFARIVDPAMPGWLVDELDSFTPRLFDRYARSLGPFKGDRPMIVASWKPSAMTGISQGGSVNPGMITMTFEGAGLLAPNPAVASGVKWFIGHESAHFWLGETIHADTPDRAWMTEGGADLMAARAVKESDPGFDDARFIANARRDCAEGLKAGGVEGAGLRNENRPYYACGMVFALAVEAAGQPRGEDFFAFVRRLITANPDGVVTREEWLDAARGFGLTDEQLARMVLMLDGARSDGAADIAALLGG